MAWWMFALAAALIWGLHYNLLSVALSTISPMTAYWLPTVVCCLGLPIFGKQVWNDLQSTYAAPMEVKISVAAIMFTSLFATLCLYRAIQLHNPVHVGLIEITFPIFVTLIAAFVFGNNHLNLGTVAGGMLILIGSGIVIYTNG